MQLRLKTLKSDETRRMKTARTYTKSRIYHPNAYDFVFAALRFAQEKLGRDRTDHSTGHVCGRELLDGIAELARDHFGLLAISVLAGWGVHGTEDIGKMVLEYLGFNDYDLETFKENFAELGISPNNYGLN